MDIQDAVKYFRMEAQEHLEGINEGLLTLESEPGDADTIKTLFRLAHTLKGSARMVSLNDLGSVAHKMEDVLGVLRDGGGQASEVVISAMLAAVQIIEQMVAGLDQESISIDTAPVIDQLGGALLVVNQKATAAEAPPAPTAAAPIKADTPGDVQPDDQAVQPKTSQAVTSPEASPLKIVAESVVENPGSRRAVSPRRAAKKSSSGDHKEHLRVSLGKVDMLANLTSELVINKIQVAEQTAKMQALSHDVLRVVRSVNDIQAWSRSAEVQRLLEGTDIGKSLSAVLSRTSTVALRERLKGIITDAKGHLAQLDHVVSTLHEGVMDLRMLPASTITTPLRLVVRETALDVSRQVYLELEGEDIEVDKTLLEGLKEALAHLIRNAIDHGIEDSDERRAMGKPEEGRIYLRFTRRGSHLLVSVVDDGCGVNLQRVRERVVERKMLDAASAEVLTPAELFRFMMLPGFSTASEVTKTSGRGVGLDVVASNVRTLKGSIEFSSAAGKGTTVNMSFPVNLATMDGFMFRSGHRIFSVPLEHVVQVRTLKGVETDTCAQCPVVQVEGESLSYLSLSELLGGSAESSCDEVVILRWGGDKIALGIDSVVGVRTMIVKPLDPHIGELPWVSGITILTSGRLAVILEVEHLFKVSEDVTSGAARSSSTQGVSTRQDDGNDISEGKAAVTVLVVDDSLSARMMEKGMLESSGYHVVLACDGEEGLEKLSRGGVDIVISDVEMPRMTGLEMVKHLRNRAGSRDIPVIIISSLGEDEDRKRGLDVGADAYLVKGELNQGALVGAVERLVGESK